MIVPMKKISLLVLDSQREPALKKLRKIGLLHIQVAQGTSTRLTALREQSALLESGIFIVGERMDKNTMQQECSPEKALEIAQEIAALTEDKKKCHAQIAARQAELERLKDWGEIDPAALFALEEQDVSLLLCEMPAKNTTVWMMPFTQLHSGAAKPPCASLLCKRAAQMKTSRHPFFTAAFNCPNAPPRKSGN